MMNRRTFHRKEMNVRRSEIADDLKDLAFDFLYFFARLEFTLKANGYLKKPNPGQPAEAGWK